MADKTMPTPGRVILATSNSYRRFVTEDGMKPVITPTVHPRDGHPDLIISEGDACFVEAAYAAAHECAEMGYDPIEAVRALPTLLGEYAFQHGYDAAEKFLARAAGKEEN
jgi:hypothetical protein